MSHYAIFVRRWAPEGPRGSGLGNYGPRRYVGHVYTTGVMDTRQNRQRACVIARGSIAGPPFIRSCDVLEAVRDHSRGSSGWWMTVPAPTGVGLL